MTQITLHNTKTRKKEVLEPIRSGEVSMYVCGPTVYDRAHLGNARPVIVFDTLFRLLRHVYGEDKVTYVRNFTDVDDKINARAAETGQSIREITDGTIALYLEDMGSVGALQPNQMPRATEYIAPMVSMTADLIEKGFAYEAEGHVLFAVESYPDYGKLSGRSVDDMIAGARVEVAPYKRNPMDFVLWKPSDEETPGWDSPWGKGRPGWHIECSAMAHELLGESFDIHGGGNDLMFPHHENEIAQSKCAGHDFANVWMHNEMLQVEGKKMSKSLGNFFTVRDLLDQGVPGEVIRFVMLSTHYRKPMDWTEKKREEAEATLTKIAKAIYPFSAEIVEPPLELVEALADDLNTSKALTILRRLLKEKKKPELVSGLKLLGFDPQRIFNNFASVAFGALVEEGEDNSVWTHSGLDHKHNLSTPQPDQKILLSLGDRFVQVRLTAMESKDFSELDALKSALIGAGVEVRMSKEGVDLVPGPDFDATGLEGLL